MRVGGNSRAAFPVDYIEKHFRTGEGYMKRSNLIVIALTSVTLLAMELVWTRLFSAEFFYTFAFLIISLAFVMQRGPTTSTWIFPLRE